MSMNTILRSTAILAILAAPLTAFAQSDEMRAMVSALESEGVTLASGFADLSDDGNMEGFVAWSDSCDSSVGCRWVIVSESGGTPEISHTRFGSNPHLGVDGRGLPSVMSDGVSWRIVNGDVIVPGESGFPSDMWTKATSADLDLLVSTTDFTLRNEMDVYVTSVDLNGNGTPETIMSVGGTYYAMVGGSYTPYTIHAGSGELLHTGYSADGPRIYLRDAGATVVEVTPAGVNVKLLE